MTKFFFIAGEKSGDNIGSRLIRELKKSHPTAEFVGAGGTSMINEGMKNLLDLSPLSIIGYWQVLKIFFTFKKIFTRLIQIILEQQPDILITIDSPGLNYRIVKKLRSLGFKGKIIHYVAPTVWAYKQGRAVDFAKIFDGLICVLPFEPKYFIDAGLDTIYAGHPLTQDYLSISDTASKEDYILVTPGSRVQEINYLMPIFMPVLSRLAAEYNLKVKFLTTENQISLVQNHLQMTEFTYEIVTDTDNKIIIIKNAKMAISKSGTITLEIALAGTPQIMCYKIDFLTGFLAKRIVKIKHLSLPNIILGKEIVPELIQENLSIESLYQEAKKLLSNPDTMLAQRNFTKELAKILGSDDANSPSEKAASFITKILNKA